MKAVAQLAERERRELFNETASVMNITGAAAEKDFWICWVLLHIFEDDDLNRWLRFKGGTSLSKCYGAIERFSEDIDLILDWNQVTQQDPVNAERSRTQQQKLNTAINQQAQGFIAETLLPRLVELMGDICTLAIDEHDPHTINITYPKAFDSQYLRPQVRLEIGPLAAMLPMERCTVKPYAAEQFPSVFKRHDIIVPTISAARTFWEKLTILHAEAHRPADKPLPSRYARHYYDVYKMVAKGLHTNALAKVTLLEDVVAFKQRFYPSGWAKYDLATLAALRLLPAPTHKQALADDYQNMHEMLFGQKPDFADILSTLEALQADIHALGATTEQQNHKDS